MTHPEPLVPQEVDLRDFAFMPLDVVRLRDSDLAAEEGPEACWAAVLIWCASWHQVPAGSIPNSDQWMAKQAGYVARGKVDATWKTVRAGALRNWVECSDGRLYHPVIAEKALESWRAKQAQRERTRKATEERERRRREADAARGDRRDVPRDDSRDDERNVHQGTVKGQGQGQGQGDSRRANALPASDGDEGQQPEPNLRGRLGKALKAAGIDPTKLNLQDPRVSALLAQGATVEEFAGIAKEAVDKGVNGSPLGWICTTLANRREQAAATTIAPTPADPAAWRKSDLATRAMASQLGVTYRDGESAEDWERRIFTAWQRAGKPALKPTETA